MTHAVPTRTWWGTTAADQSSSTAAVAAGGLPRDDATLLQNSESREKILSGADVTFSFGTVKWLWLEELFLFWISVGMLCSLCK